MTIETSRAPTSAAAGGDADLLAGLWEEAPFARLPWDAPAELRDLVEEVDNPRRVYAVHRASRRHNFQLIVQKYIVQLREGCGVSTCCNPTCLTCRKRIAGRSPLRRYNTTSARTLAIHLASQDNPEAGLCPALRLPKAPPAALNSLMFSPKYVPSAREDGASGNYKAASNGFARGGQSKDRFSTAKSGNSGQTPSVTKGNATETTKVPRTQTAKPAVVPAASHRDSSENFLGEPKFTVTDKPVSKDYRSFAANMFGTVAFKMLEWLTPAAVEEMTETADKLQGGSPPTTKKESKSSSDAPTAVTPTNEANPEAADGHGNESQGTAANGSAVPSERNDDGAVAKGPVDATNTKGLEVDSSQPLPATFPLLPTGHTNANGSALRNASALVRTPASTKQPQRRVSVDAFPSDTDDLLPALRSPRLSGLQGDTIGPKTTATKPLKASTSTIPRPISQLSNAGFFDGVSLEKMPPLPKTFADAKSKAGRAQIDISLRSGSDSSLPQSRSSSSQSLSSDRSSSDQSSAPNDADDVDSTLDALLPQTLTRLNAEVVDFVCDILQDDYTREQHLLEPPTVTKFHTKVDGHSRPLKRKQKPRPYRQSPRLGEEWRMFVEQSLFYVLSNPHALLLSFSKQGQLYDTQTLWYCMLRLTRVAPSLVLHSLWTAAESLFAPSKAIRALRLPTARLFPRVRQATLTDFEAGMLMSICLHALVAVAPVVNDVRKLYDMSRIRSQGLSLAGSGSVARQPAELCLQYDDAFSSDLAMRLAKRLFAAITTRRFFGEMIEHSLGSLSEVANRNENGPRRGGDSSGSTAAAITDVLAPLFAQLDFLNMDAAYILNFSVPDRTLHETRVPTLLLDWARAVMLHEWSGYPVVPGDGPFGGALALIAAIYEKRQALLVGDIQFRSEYFAERLDEVDMPVAWLSFTSTRQKCHLLDFPYIFSPGTLVSYFRSINFSRMSRSFEESSSLQSRMNAIISPGSLIINPHHKTVLQDLLKTASTKYLILDIGRATVLQDAFDQLWRREERELLRPLKVHLGEDGGEEGFDSGGVQQEFFRLALAEALNPNYGAFTVDDRTRMAWFSPATLEEDWKFELIGLLVSLALFNGLSLPVTFPKALYRKLLGESVNELHHIADGWPDLASGLTVLLEWNEQDGAVEDIFVRTYEFSVDMFGQPISRVMGESEHWPHIRQSVLAKDEEAPVPTPSDASGSESSGGERSHEDLVDGNPDDNAPMVTNENRNAYVTDYICYLTDVSVRSQYEAFARGFRTCLHPKSLKLLTPSLLQSLVEGQQDIDIAELRRHARYVGWDASHPAVRDFWGIVSRYDDRMKRKLLEFVTASDRVPVGGVKNMQFVVQRNGEEEGECGHLPTAYTCYGTLLLPEYQDREVLRERLAMALENAQGFGFA